MNTNSQDEKLQKRKFQLYLVFVLVYFSIAFTISGYILAIKREATEQVWIGKGTQGIFNLDQIVWNYVEFCRMKIFEFFFVIAVNLFTRWQNLKYVEDHERIVLISLVSFQLVNNSLHLLVIGANQLFGKRVLVADDNGKLQSVIRSTNCANQDCNRELEYFFAVYCIFQLSWYLFYHYLIRRLLHYLQILLRKWKNRRGKRSSQPQPESKESILKAEPTPLISEPQELLYLKRRQRRSTYMAKTKTEVKARKVSITNIFACLKDFINLLDVKGYFQAADMNTASIEIQQLFMSHLTRR